VLPAWSEQLEVPAVLALWAPPVLSEWLARLARLGLPDLLARLVLLVEPVSWGMLERMVFLGRLEQLVVQGTLELEGRLVRKAVLERLGLLVHREILEQVAAPVSSV